MNLLFVMLQEAPITASDSISFSSFWICILVIEVCFVVYFMFIRKCKTKNMELSNEQQNDMLKKCPFCNNHIKIDAKYCSNCGKKVDEEQNQN